MEGREEKGRQVGRKNGDKERYKGRKEAETMRHGGRERKGRIKGVRKENRRGRKRKIGKKGR